MSSGQHLPAHKKRTMIVKQESASDPSLGKAPEERTVEELIEYGIVNLDKPTGPTSHQISAWVKDIFGVEKTGHAGTLDPNVSGVLPVTLGKATRAQKVMLEGGKEYVGLAQYKRPLNKKEVKEIFEEFTGKVLQFPPRQAAVARKLRTREIYYNEVLEVKKNTVLFKTGCESGTYIRVLATDIGRVLGNPGKLVELRRTISSMFNEEDSVTLHDLKDAYVAYTEDGDDTEIRQFVQPVERIFDHVGRVYIRDSAVDAVCHGADLALPGVANLTSGIERGNVVGVMSLKGEIVGWGKALLTTDEITNGKEGIAVNVSTVMMDAGTYPKMWKTSTRAFEGG